MLIGETPPAQSGARPRLSWRNARLVVDSGWVSDIWSHFGLAVVTWLAFGSAFAQLGHHGDSWSYMSMIRDAGPLTILEAQPGRVALPLAWAIGYAVAGPAPWIYHLLMSVFLLGSAICLYWTLLALAPGARLFAFATAALSVLWPSDPTRYDAATLGNRQSLFFFSLGVLFVALAWLRSRPLPLAFAAGVVFSLATLTYEAPVFLIVGMVALILMREHGPRRAHLAAAGIIPVGVWVIVNAAALALSGGHTYQVNLTPTHDPIQLAQNTVAGLTVVLIDAWRTPYDLLRNGVVPSPGFVASASLVSLLWMVPLMGRASRLPGRATCRNLIGLAAVATVLSLGVFAAANIPMSQPDRTQTFAVVWAAILFTSACAWALSWVPSRIAAQLVFGLACLPGLTLFFAMAAVYQRNYIQTWNDQRAVLQAIVQRAPNIPDGSLVLVSGLPDTRIVFVSGYTCEFALSFLEGRAHLPAQLRYTARSADELVPRRINCGLQFDGRDLDYSQRVEPTAEGVSEQLPPFTYLYPFRRVLDFAFDQGPGAHLLDTLPPPMPPSGAVADPYDPLPLLQPAVPDGAAQHILATP